MPLPKSIKLGLKLAVTLAVLGYLVSVVPIAEVGQVLITANPWLFLGGILVQVAVRALAAVRIKVLGDAQGLGLSWSVVLRILYASAFYGLLLPGVIAGGATALLKYVQHGGSVGAALATIVASRMTETLVVVVAGVVCWVLERATGAPGAVMTVSGGIASLALMTGLMFRSSQLPAVVVGRVALRTGRDQRPLLRRLRAFLGRLARLEHMRWTTVAAVTVLAVLQVLAGGLALACFSLALGLDLRIVTLLWVRSAVQVAMLLPISVGGLGVREGLLVVLLAPYGIEAAPAMALSLTMFAGTLAAALAGGVVEAHAFYRGAGGHARKLEAGRE